MKREQLVTVTGDGNKWLCSGCGEWHVDGSPGAESIRTRGKCEVCVRDDETEAKDTPDKPELDRGPHYRREYRGVKLDPYRIALIYGITHPTQFHMLKKLLRGTSKGHTQQELVDELSDCVRRWREMQVEDGQR